MAVITEIFAEYVNMRTNGLSVNETLIHLRPFIDGLPKTKKQELGGYVRAWEKTTGATIKQTQPAPAVGADHVPGNRPIKEDASSAVDNTETQPTPRLKSLAKDPSISEKAVWITCANCERKNRLDTVFCYSCGHMLEQVQGKYGTRQFAEASTEMFDPLYFSKDSLLVMRIRDLDFDYELRPQVKEHELVVGRITVNSAMAPDVDLSACNAERLGVSRLHMALRYEKATNAIHIYDLGSANGTFVNGQKLHPKEMRILRDGDEVRLGRLVTRMIYQHPGEEIG